MADRLIVIDGYNLIHRTPQLRPDPISDGAAGRTLRDSREKLINLLTWMMGTSPVHYLVVFDGSAERGIRDDRSGRVEVRFSRPPKTADHLIREIVEDQIERVESLTVVTADLEVARHARAMGADVALSDLFLASALGGAKDAAPDEKPTTTLSRKELEQWAEIFRSRPPAERDDEP